LPNGTAVTPLVEQSRGVLGLDDVPANVTVPFVGVLDASAPSEVGVMCRDNGDGVSWRHVRILATQASELHIQTMHAG
jgi:hypothetical protein